MPYTIQATRFSGGKKISALTLFYLALVYAAYMIRRFLPLKKNVDSLIAGLAGFTIILLFTHYGGVGVSPDSVVYVSAAGNLSSHGRFIDFTQQPVVNFPVFYPFFLSVIEWLTGLKVVAFGVYLNAILFAGTICLCGHVMEQFVHRSRWYKIAVLSALAFSPALLEDFVMLWSETIFIIEIILFMMCMHRYFFTHSIKRLITAAIIVSLACITRYAGITIIATGGMVLLLDTKLVWRKKLFHIVVFSIVSSSFLIVNLVRNHIVSGNLTGAREKSLTTLTQNLRDAGTAFCDWLPFFHHHEQAAIGVAVTIIIVLLIACLQQFLSKRRIADYLSMSAAFSLLYILFMITTATISRFEELNSRFMSPVFIPLAWCGSYWMVVWAQKIENVKKRVLITILLVVFIGFQYNQLKADYETWIDVKDDGVPGYAEDDWKYSDTVQFIEADSLPFKNKYTIYSDAPDAIYYFTGRLSKYLPHNDFPGEVQQFMNDRQCYLVWFTLEEDPDLVGLELVVNRKKMKLLKKFSDGAIYISDQ